MITRVRAVVFDKDGTILDFEQTWNPAIARAIDILASGEPELVARLGVALGYDVERGVTLPNAPLIAASNAEVVALLPGDVDGERFPSLLAEAVLDSVSPALHAPELLDLLAGHGVPMSVATNDDEASSIAQFERLDWLSHFSCVLGYDSGHGAKPDPGMVIAAARRMDVAPHDVVMVGDNQADIHAGRAAGALTVYVGPEPDTRGAGADHHIATLAELPDLLA